VRTTGLSVCHSHSALLQTDCHLNVPHHYMSSGHAIMPAQRHVDVGLGSSGCFQVYSGGSLMGNRLPDCAVGSVLTSTGHQQSVSGLMDTRTYRDCSQWSSAQPAGTVLRHSSSSDWSSRQHLVPSYNVNRSVWADQQSPATVNGIDTHCNYAPSVHMSQVYAQQACSRMPNQFLSTNMPAAARLCGVNVPVVSMQQMWMQAQPHQQQQQHQIARNACHNGMTMSPIQSPARVCTGQSCASPTAWQSRFASQSLNNAQLSAGHVTAAASTSQSEYVTTMSAAVPCHVTAPSCGSTAVSVSDSSSLRNNTVGRVYQLPVHTAAMTAEHSEHVTCSQSSVVVCASSSTSVSLSTSVTTSKPICNMKPYVKAVITPSQPETERTYVAGRRYTVTKENGVTVEGIWDGKYLTVLTTTAANTTASQTSGLFVCYLLCVIQLDVCSNCSTA